MSYILEALRRAQNERERGQVPGLNAQPATGPAEPPPRAGLAVPWPVLGAGLVVALLGLVVWLWRGGPPAAPPAAAVPAVTAAPAVAVSQPAAPAAAALPVVVSAPPPAAPAPSTQASAATPVPGALPAPVPGATPAHRMAPRALSLAELSSEQRRDLPPLVMGGSIWSESALGRFVIVNGQVVREGEAAAPGVTVEGIGPKAVLLRWRDLRFEVPL